MFAIPIEIRLLYWREYRLCRRSIRNIWRFKYLLVLVRFLVHWSLVLVIGCLLILAIVLLVIVLLVILRVIISWVVFMLIISLLLIVLVLQLLIILVSRSILVSKRSHIRWRLNNRWHLLRWRSITLLVKSLLVWIRSILVIESLLVWILLWTVALIQ